MADTSTRIESTDHLVRGIGRLRTGRGKGIVGWDEFRAGIRARIKLRECRDGLAGLINFLLNHWAHLRCIRWTNRFARATLHKNENGKNES